MEHVKSNSASKLPSAILLIFFFFLTAPSIPAQHIRYVPKQYFQEPVASISSRYLQSSVTPVVDSVELLTDTFVQKIRFWRAAGELMLAQVIPWAFNYYVRDAEFAHITWES